MKAIAYVLLAIAALWVVAHWHWHWLARLAGWLRARRDRRARERLRRAGVVSLSDRRVQLRRIERSSWVRRPIDPLRVNRYRDNH